MDVAKMGLQKAPGPQPRIMPFAAAGGAPYPSAQSAELPFKTWKVPQSRAKPQSLSEEILKTRAGIT